MGKCIFWNWANRFCKSAHGFVISLNGWVCMNILLSLLIPCHLFHGVGLFPIRIVYEIGWPRHSMYHKLKKVLEKKLKPKLENKTK